LGIIIGTATIAVIVGIGVGAQQNVEDQYSNLSVTSIFVNPSAENLPSKNSVKDTELIMEQAKYISSAIPQISNRYLFSNGNVSDQYTLVGTTSEFATDLKFEYLEGSFFNVEDEESKSKKIVLGFNVAEGIFGQIDSSVIG
jgi:putative ABC transport system permease protein